MSQTTRPVFKEIRLFGRDKEPFVFEGALIGVSSSRGNEHSHVGRTQYAVRGVRCSACRWFSVEIYLRPDDSYVVHTVGDTIVPDERRLARVTATTSGYEVVEILTVRKPGAEPFITAQSARALAQASSVDDGIREAYVDRAVI
jgi:hypothetical protein